MPVLGFVPFAPLEKTLLFAQAAPPSAPPKHQSRKYRHDPEPVPQAFRAV